MFTALITQKRAFRPICNGYGTYHVNVNAASMIGLSAACFLSLFTDCQIKAKGQNIMQSNTAAL